MRRLSRAPAAVLGLVALLGLLAAPLSARAGGLWIHVHAEEAGGELVRVNVPMSLVKTLLPLLEDQGGFHDGVFVIEDGDLTIDAAEVREALDALEAAEDGEYVTVLTPAERVRVSKKSDRLYVRVDERYGDRVDVRVPLAVVRAMIGRADDELDVLAGVEALARAGGGELVSVRSPDTRVRIWIDDRASGKGADESEEDEEEPR